MKTLVTIGYHNGELLWGQQVRTHYERNALKNGRNITFHEITDSDVETGYVCEKSVSEIEKKIAEGNFGLWIDIHCGFEPENHGEIVLRYLGKSDILISRARLIEGVKTADMRNMPEKHISGYIKALSDVFFSREEFDKKGPIYQKGLERTVEFINQIHDIHLEPAFI